MHQPAPDPTAGDAGAGPTAAEASPGPAVMGMVVLETAAAGGRAPGAGELAVAVAHRSDQDPRLVYLASLGTDESRRAISGALAMFARALGTTAAELPWPELRYQHTQAVR